MDLEEWRAGFTTLAAQIADFDDLDHRAALRAALILVYRHMIRLPVPHAEATKTIEETALAAIMQSFQPAWSSQNRFSHLSQLLHANRDAVTAFAATRLLDETLKSLAPEWRDSPALDRQPADRWRCPITQDFCIPAFVEPLPDSGTIAVKSRTSGTFIRRGAIHHRIMPAKIGDLSVVPIDLTDIIFCKTRLRATMGSALFSDFQIIPKHPPPTDRFQLVNAHFDGGENTILSHIDNGCASNCSAIIWPELSLTPANQAAISAALARRTHDLSETPSIVVAGSWHLPGDRDDPSIAVNRAVVMDYQGNVRATHEKFNQFIHDSKDSDKCMGEEDIDAGKNLLVLVFADICASVAICLDFCNLIQPLPYLSLDVDLMLVTSLGNESTIKGHSTNAAAMQMRFGTRSFVVQQRIPDDKTPENSLGWHIASPEKSNNISPSIQHNSWATSEITLLRAGTSRDSEAL